METVLTLDTEGRLVVAEVPEETTLTVDKPNEAGGFDTSVFTGPRIITFRRTQ
jgi:hypothetical protein